MLACVLFARNRNYFILLFIGVFLSSFGSTANPQMFALAREHADRTGREAVMFSSISAPVSRWLVIGPLAYALAMGFSFTVMYLSAAVALSSAASWCGSFTVNAQRCAAGDRHAGSTAS